jgi:ATP synthase protein I
VDAPKADHGRGDGPGPWAYAGLGFEIAVPLALGVFVGYKLDQWLGTRPWLVLTGAVLGIAAGLLNFFRVVLPPKERGPGNGAG